MSFNRTGPYSEDPQSLLDKLGGDIETGESYTRKEDQFSRQESTQEIAATNEDIQKAAKEDIDFLAGLVMPTVFKYCFPDIYKHGVWPWLVSYVHKYRAFPQLALGLPRGFAKTTFMKLFLIYCILYTDKKFILVIAATAQLARNIVSDIIDMLEEPNIKAVFGDWKTGVEKDTQDLKKFGFRGRNITLAAIGAQGSLRGLNIKNERPDIMLFDDIQSKEDAESQVISEALEKWMIGTAMKAKSPTGCMFLFLANMYPTKYSLLKKLKHNKTWVKFITGGILSDGTSLWEELQPIEQLMQEFQNDLASGHPEIFYSEVLNDENAAANNLIDLSSIPDIPNQEGDIPAGNFIVIDPATDKANSDEVSVGYFEVHDGYPVLMKLKEDRMSPGETIREALKLALANNCRLVACESNSYQYTFLYWFDFICKQVGIQGIECVPVYSGMNAKNSRILTMFKSYAQGELFVHPDCRPAVHLQITQFNPLKRDNTDGLLDLLTYAPKIMSEFGEFIVMQNIIEHQEFEAIEVPDFNTSF